MWKRETTPKLTPGESGQNEQTAGLTSLEELSLRLKLREGEKKLTSEGRK